MYFQVFLLPGLRSDLSSSEASADPASNPSVLLFNLLDLPENLLVHQDHVFTGERYKRAPLVFAVPHVTSNQPLGNIAILTVHVLRLLRIWRARGFTSSLRPRPRRGSSISCFTRVFRRLAVNISSGRTPLLSCLSSASQNRARFSKLFRLRDIVGILLFAVVGHTILQNQESEVIQGFQNDYRDQTEYS